MKHFNITVKGKVQGVWYRKSTQDKAIELGITGFVKNLADGRVYIEAEGPETQLRELVAWCRQGPPKAVVADLEVTESQLIQFDDFRIAR